MITAKELKLGALTISAPISPRTQKFLTDHNAEVTVEDNGFITLSGDFDISKAQIQAFLEQKQAEDGNKQNIQFNKTVHESSQTSSNHFGEINPSQNFLTRKLEKIKKLILEGMKEDNPKKFHEAVELGANLTVFDIDGIGLTFVAAINNKHKVLEFLIENKHFDVNQVNQQVAEIPETPLMCAVAQGHIESITMLLELGANVHYANDEGVSALLLAAELGNFEIIKLLVTVGKADVNCRADNNVTPVYIAAAKGFYEILDFLLRNKADPNGKAKDNFGNSALHEAAGRNHAKCVKLLLDKGVDPNVQNDTGSVPLFMTATSGALDAAQLLLTMGANKDYIRKSDGVNVLHLAIAANKIAMAKFFIEAGAKLNVITTENQWNEIHCLMKYGSDNAEGVQLLKIFLSKGIDPNMADKFGQRPLWLAAFYNKAGFVPLLLQFKADPTMSSCGKTPFEVARLKGHSAFNQVLLGGKDVEVKERSETGTQDNTNEDIEWNLNSMEGTITDKEGHKFEGTMYELTLSRGTIAVQINENGLSGPGDLYVGIKLPNSKAIYIAVQFTKTSGHAFHIQKADNTLTEPKIILGVYKTPANYENKPTLSTFGSGPKRWFNCDPNDLWVKTNESLHKLHTRGNKQTETKLQRENTSQTKQSATKNAAPVTFSAESKQSTTTVNAASTGATTVQQSHSSGASTTSASSSASASRGTSTSAPANTPTRGRGRV